MRILFNVSLPLSSWKLDTWESYSTSGIMDVCGISHSAKNMLESRPEDSRPRPEIYEPRNRPRSITPIHTPPLVPLGISQQRQCNDKYFKLQRLRRVYFSASCFFKVLRLVVCSTFKVCYLYHILYQHCSQVIRVNAWHQNCSI